MKHLAQAPALQLPVGSEVMVPFWGLCEVLQLIEGDLAGHPARLYVMQPETASHVIHVPQKDAEELGVRALLTPEQMSAVLEQPHTAELMPEEHPKVRYGRLMSILRTGRPSARREVLVQLNRAGHLEPYESELRDRVSRNFAREVQKSLRVEQSEAAERVRVVTV